jgi:hypothetical protein
MQRGRLIAELIVDVDNDSVANSRLDTRNGPLSIDPDGRSITKTVGVSGDPSNSEVISLGLSGYESQ